MSYTAIKNLTGIMAIVVLAVVLSLGCDILPAWAQYCTTSCVTIGTYTSCSTYCS